MMRVLIRRLACGFVVLATGCSTMPLEGDALVSESRLGWLRLDASIGRSVLRVGDTTTAVFRLRNVGTALIELEFASGCQVLPYVSRPNFRDIVFPPEGHWMCTAALSDLSLAPGQEKVTTLLLHGGATQQAMAPFAQLPQGEYRVFARLEHPDYPLQSVPLAVRVR